MFRGRVVEPGIVFLVAAVLALVMTFPMVLQLGSMARVDTGDGQFSIWIVSWVARTLIADPARLYDANIFYPHTSTLAYSETFFIPGVLAVPGYWATRNPYFAHNTSLLLGLILTWVATFYLVRYLTGNRWAAGVSAILFTFCPYLFARTAHIHLMATYGLPLTLLALHRLVDQPAAWRALALGAALAVAALSAGYYGIFAALICAVAGPFYLVSRSYWRRREYYTWLAVAALVSFAIVGPFFWPFLELKRESGPLRTLQEAAAWSATWRAYLAGAGYGDRWMLPLIKKWNEVLFPGFTALALGAVGLWAGSRHRGRPRASEGQPGATAAANVATDGGTASLRETVLFYALVGVVAFWFSFGPSAGLYTVLYQALPVFSFLRAPARMGIVVTLALAVLGGIGLARLLEGRRRAPLVAALVALVALSELAVAPLRFRQAPPFNSVYRVLASLPPGGVAEFPFFYLQKDFHRHCYYMLNSTVHWRPLVNGYSDYIPPDFVNAVIDISTFPSDVAFRRLRERKARYVVFHMNFYDHRMVPRVLRNIERYEREADLRPLAKDGDVLLYEIVNWPS